MWRLYFLAALVAVTAAAPKTHGSTNNTYIIIVPKDIRPGVPLNMSVNILHATAPVNVRAEIVGVSNNAHVASVHGSFNQDVPGTLSLQIPDTLASGTYKVVVHGTHGLKFQDETTLHFESKSMSVFVQTDKAMYKPGQTVHFRTFAIYPNLTVYTGPIDVEIHDPNTNKIKQWLAVKGTNGVFEDQMIMDTQPVLGDWKIKVTAHGRSQEKIITIAHYVLPKFEVTVELPPFGVTSDTDVTGKVIAKYTYGKPVKGTVDLLVKMDHWYRPYNYHGDEPTIRQTFTVDGEHSFSVPLAHLQQISRNNLNGQSLVVEANVTEGLTHITLHGSSKVKFYSHATKLEFLKSNPKTFKPGLPYTAYLRIAQQDDRPVMGAKHDVGVSTRVTYELEKPSTTPYPWYSPRTSSYTLPVHTFVVPDSGIVAIQVDIPGNATNINLDATYDSLHAYQSLQKSYSPSDSYIQLFLKSSQLRAGHAASFELKSTQGLSTVVYQILSRGAIVSAGKVDGGNHNTVNFNIPITPKMAPNARIVVYYVRADGEVVTDSISFDVDGAFENEVTISFDKTKAQPHEGVNVQVTAAPNSIVNLLAVDQSVLLLKSGNDITQSEVIDELKTYDTIKQAHNPFCCFGGPVMFGRKKRMIWYPYPTYFGGSDAQQIFANAGVKVMTDATIYHHPQQIYPQRYFEKEMARPMAVDGMMAPAQQSMHGGASVMKKVDRIRTNFPETWLWTNKTVGADGHVTIASTVPDTITSWIASAFAVNSVSGLGIAANTAKLEAFRPFFVSLNLPYSVVRGEQLVLQAVVFNYMSQDMDTVVTLEQSNDFRSVIVDASGHESYVSKVQTDNVHIPAGGAKSVYFPIVPAALGKIDLTVKAQSASAADAVKRQLLVEPEGVAKEYNQPILIDLKQTSSFSKTVPVTLPAGVVAGSQIARVTAIGDLMGPSVNGLDKLLRQPTGCGEQTMLGLAPDIFITDYLTATNQLSGDIQDKALNFMEKGYQRELTFQHKDGSFSAFGDRDNSGSMWLSAFVVKSFHQAKKYIFVDDDMIARAIDWMIARQSADGSFPEPGRVIHKNMQGGSASGPALSAFVLIALLENKDVVSGGVDRRLPGAISKATAYLEHQVPSMTDDYALAISSYALALAKSGSAAATMARLNQDAVDKDGMKHWHKVATTTSHHSHWNPPHKQSNPIDIEMSAYALLVYAGHDDFPGGMPIMKWITTQRNPQGGFASTQDTVLALQALSQFARMVYSSSFNMDITVTAGTFTKHFNINPKNALVLQSVELPTIPSQVTVSATGHGMGLVDVAIFFHVEQEIEVPSFEVTVKLVEETVDTLKVQACSRWLKAGASGMAVLELGVPTGFEADVESIGTVINLKKTETENRKVILYFDEIGTTPTCFVMEALRTGLVAKSQPAPVRLFDYYEPANQVTAFYQSQLLKDSSICDICEECKCPAKGAGRR